MGKAEILEKGIRDYLSGDYARTIAVRWNPDGEISKNDRCVHHRWRADVCKACICEHFLGVLAAAEKYTPTPDAEGAE